MVAVIPIHIQNILPVRCRAVDTRLKLGEELFLANSFKMSTVLLAFSLVISDIFSCDTGYTM